MIELCVLITYLDGTFGCMLLSFTYGFQSQSTLCSSLNVKELLARIRHEI